jgi:cellulose synthase/poly-beta-1,6-N-acetylglucosamine synthase-like glycosyltransferase
MRFSIVIPAHNEEKYLPACLASVDVASGSHPGEAEVVVALNRYTDSTEAVARSAGAKTVVGGARNMVKICSSGAKVVTGELLIANGADGAKSPNMLRVIDGRLSSGSVAILPER